MNLELSNTTSVTDSREHQRESVISKLRSYSDRASELIKNIEEEKTKRKKHI